jgi:ribosomal protein S27AE
MRYWWDSPEPDQGGRNISGTFDVPEAYRQYFFVNAGGPLRKVVSREAVQKKWQLVTLECSHGIIMPKHQKAANVRCGFCGRLQPLS